MVSAPPPHPPNAALCLCSGCEAYSELYEGTLKGLKLEGCELLQMVLLLHDLQRWTQCFYYCFPSSVIRSAVKVNNLPNQTTTTKYG